MKRHQKLIAAAAALALLAMARPAAAATYTIDPAHANIGFEVDHLKVSKTRGSFNDFTGTITFDAEDPAATEVEVSIKTASIDTGNSKRDEHLKSRDFLLAEEHPQITFRSTSIKPQGDGLLINGDLTIRGVTQPVSLPVVIYGPMESPFGGQVIGLAGQTVIDRQDFGVSWNKQLDTGGVVVGDEVLIDVNVEAGAK